MDKDPPPNYNSIPISLSPPPYTSAVHHISFGYYKDESHISLKDNSLFIPVIFELNSTQINLYKIDEHYEKFVSHYFNDLNSEFVDPNLNIKSKLPAKLNCVGLGIGSSMFLPQCQQEAIPNSIPSSCSNSSTDLASVASSINSSSSLKSSTSSLFDKHSSRLRNSFAINKLFDRLSINNIGNSNTIKKSETNYEKIKLKEEDKFSVDSTYIQKLLNCKPDINSIFDPDFTPEEAQIVSFKLKLFKSFSLQELIKFGNAYDFHEKPFTLRLMFPADQFLLVSYNANTFASIFYKLNIAKEISLDLDLRISEPIDYCVPRRSRHRRRRVNSNLNPMNRTRSNTVSRISTRSRSGSLVSATRTMTNDLNVLNDDEDDELDDGYEIELANRQLIQPSTSSPSHVQIQQTPIFEEEILRDIDQLPLAEQVVSNAFSINSRSTSIFSTMERYASTATDITMMTTSLSPIHSINSDSNNSIEISNDDKLNANNLDNKPNSKYKELIFALKCMKSCRNKTLPWVG